MQEITEQLFAGADKPMQEAARKLPAEMGKVADGILDEARRMADIQEYFNTRLSASGLRAQVAATTGIIDTGGIFYSIPPALAAKSAGVHPENIHLEIVVQNMNVRDDTDVHLVSRELFNLTKSELFVRGVKTK
jgi:hypothetical protein